MAGEQSLPRTQVQERQADAMWKHLAGEISSGPFVEHQQPGKQTRDSGSWNISPGPYSDNRDLLFQSMSAAAAAGNMNMMNTVLLPESSSHGGFFGSSSELWSGVEGSDRQTGMPIISAGLAEFMEIDAGFDSPYMSFTECLQAGLQMDASDYSRSLGQTAAGGAAPFDFSSPLTAEERAEAEAEAGAGAGAGAGSGHLGDTPNVPTTPVSSISSSSTEAIEDQEPSRLATVASTSGAKGGAAVPQAPGDQESLDKPSPQSKKQSKPRKKGQKRNREPRFAFMTKSDVDHLEDGYRWRKYGQKAVKNSPYPRSYYRCTNAKCSVKKRVERSFEDPSIVITTYEGQHTHQSPALLRSSGGEGAAAHMAERSTTANSSLPPFTQSSLGFSLQMMAPRTTAAASFDPGHMQQAQAQQQQQQEQETDLQSSQRHMISAVPPPHPALLQQRSQPQAAAAVPNPTDQGLLEDIVPSGMRKLS